MFDESSSITVVTDTFNSENARLNEVMSSFVKHMHNFIKEVEPSDEEWMAGIQFLTEVGHKCDDVRQEFILFSDTFGITALKDAINNRKPKEATEATVLGPFYRDGAETLPLGASISNGPRDGEPCLVRGRITDINGNPIPGAKIDVWQSNSDGFYEQQDADQPEMNLRGVFLSDSDGSYYFKSVTPKYYPIPGDGPVGMLLDDLGRHHFRPAHIHFIVSAEGYESVTTQFFDSEDPYIDSDAVFGVKDSLVVDFNTLEITEEAEQYCLAVGDCLIEFNFSLNPES